MCHFDQRLVAEAEPKHRREGLKLVEIDGSCPRPIDSREPILPSHVIVGSRCRHAGGQSEIYYSTLRESLWSVQNEHKIVVAMGEGALRSSTIPRERKTNQAHKSFLYGHRMTIRRRLQCTLVQIDVLTSHGIGSGTKAESVFSDVPTLIVPGLATFILLSIMACVNIMHSHDVQSFSLDASPNPLVRITFDISIDIPCSLVNVDHQILSGTHVPGLVDQIVKERVHEDGTSLNATELDAPRVTHAETQRAAGPKVHSKSRNSDTCGNCYGATSADECCDTCDDVMYAYRLHGWALPRVEDIAQCHASGNTTDTLRQPSASRTYEKHSSTIVDIGHFRIPAFDVASYLEAVDITLPETRLRGISPLDPVPTVPSLRPWVAPQAVQDVGAEQLLIKEKSEHCRIHGYIDARKGPGSFRISTDHASRHLLEDVMGDSLRISHVIHHLSFSDPEGPNIHNMHSGPLDGFKPPAAPSYQYYLSAVPISTTVGDGYHFTAASTSVDRGGIGRAIAFRFDVDPVRVTFADGTSRMGIVFCKILLASISFARCIDAFVRRFTQNRNRY